MKVYDVKAPTLQGPAAADQQAFLIGIDFHEAALRAGLEVLDPTGAPVVALCPMIVSYAFAAELYLKSLSATATKNHRLNVLYQRLDIPTREMLAALYRDRTGRGSCDLAEDLCAFAAAFVDWRYVFEGKGQQVHVNLLIGFTKSVYETIRQLRPTWTVRPHQDERLRAIQERPTMTVANLGGGTFLHLVDGTGGQLNTPEA